MYTKPDRRIAEVEVELETIGGTVSVGATRALFGGKSVPGSWTLSPDGTRFLVVLPKSDAASPVHLVTDWRAAVARAVE